MGDGVAAAPWSRPRGPRHGRRFALRDDRADREPRAARVPRPARTLGPPRSSGLPGGAASLRRGALTVAVVDLTPENTRARWTRSWPRARASSAPAAAATPDASCRATPTTRTTRRSSPPKPTSWRSARAPPTTTTTRGGVRLDCSPRSRAREAAAPRSSRSAEPRSARSALGPAAPTPLRRSARLRRRTTKDARAAGREEKAPPLLVPVARARRVRAFGQETEELPAAAARDWRRLTRELFGLSHRNGVCHVTHSGEAPFSLTKNKVVGLGLVPRGCAACFADGSVEALVEDAVRFERADGFGVDPAKTLISGSSPAVFRRVVAAARGSRFSGRRLGRRSTARDREGAEGTADGARLRPPAPPPRLIPTDTETLSRRHASSACLFDAETLVSAEWWPLWSGARARGGGVRRARGASPREALRLARGVFHRRGRERRVGHARVSRNRPRRRGRRRGRRPRRPGDAAGRVASDLEDARPGEVQHPERVPRGPGFVLVPAQAHARPDLWVAAERRTRRDRDPGRRRGTGLPDGDEDETNENAYPDLKETVFEVTVA